MSSTNRSNARAKHTADYYVTPKESIREFLQNFREDEEIDFWRKTILDPCAGWDQKNPMSYPDVLFEFWADRSKITTNDIREDSEANKISDFLEWNEGNCRDKFDLIITNPPFNIATQIIERSFEFVADWGYVIMLLRLNYFGSQWRKNFREKHPPHRCYVHRKRMSFTWWPTDSIEYMHCVWKQWEYNKNAILRII